MPETVGTLEVIWTIVALYGAVLAGWLCVDVIEDARNPCVTGPSEIRRKAARLCIAITASLVYTMLVFAAVGIVAMTQPSLHRDGSASAGSIAATIGFCSIDVLFVSVCVYWRAVRAHARRFGVPSTEAAILAGRE